MSTKVKYVKPNKVYNFSKIELMRPLYGWSSMIISEENGRILDIPLSYLTEVHKDIIEIVERYNKTNFAQLLEVDGEESGTYYIIFSPYEIIILQPYSKEIFKFQLKEHSLSNVFNSLLTSIKENIENWIDEFEECGMPEEKMSELTKKYYIQNLIDEINTNIK